MFFIAALQALWGSAIPISKIMLGFTPPIFLAGIRMFIAGSLLLGYHYWYSHEQFTFQKKHVWFYAQIIFFGIYLKYILRNWGLVNLSAVKMSFMLNGTPFCIALFSYIAFRETLSIRQWMGLCMGFLGLIPILLITSPAETLVGDLFVFSWAEVAILGEIAAHSYGLIVMRTMVREIGYSSVMTNGIRMFGGGALALITSFFLEQRMAVVHIAPFFFWLTLLIVISNIICHNAYLYLLKYYSATFLSFSDFLSPFFVAFYGWCFLNETITWHYFLSSILVLAGLYLFYQDELSIKIPSPFLSKFKYFKVNTTGA
jgi:drug/metabolite transporter (DMT)-like permease